MSSPHLAPGYPTGPEAADSYLAAHGLDGDTTSVEVVLRADGTYLAVGHQPVAVKPGLPFVAPDETHTDETMFKVDAALRRAGLLPDHAAYAIDEMQNAGILFRERAAVDETPAADTARPHSRASTYFNRLAGDEFIDEIRITTVPRLKTSGLSGDEWRTSVRAVALRKGRVVGERDWGRLEWALQRLLPWIQDDLLCPVDDPAMADDLCMQPGCAAPYTVEYRQIKSGCGGCGEQRDRTREWHDYRRRFCDQHATRGDGNLDDMDTLYVKITPQ